MSQPPQDRPEQQPQGQPGQGHPGPGHGPQQGRPPQGQPGQQGYPGQQGGRPPGQQGQPGQQGYPGQQGHPGQQGYPGQGGPRQGYPQQGYPQQGPQGFAGGPYGPAPQGGGYGPGGQPPYGPQPYGQPPQQQEPKKRTGLFVLIGAGALALILAVVAVAVNLGGRADTAGGSGGSGGGGATNAPAGATASDAVTGYFDALVKGDAAAAVAYAADPSTVDTTYLTPEVLAASAKRAPITELQVTPVTDPDAQSVPVSYKLGNTPVSTAVEVIKTSDDTWKLIAVATDVDITSVADPSIPMKINGTKVDKTSFSLLPGVYAFTASQKNVDLGGRSNLVVRFPNDAPDTTKISPRISPDGRDAALKAIKKSWSSCLDKKAQRPKGCPNQFRYKDFKFRDSTVRWSRKGSDPFKGIKPAYSDTTTLQYYVKRDLALRGTCSSAGRTGTCTGTLKGRVQVEARRSGDGFKIEWLV